MLNGLEFVSYLIEARRLSNATHLMTVLSWFQKSSLGSRTTTDFYPCHFRHQRLRRSSRGGGPITPIAPVTFSSRRERRQSASFAVLFVVSLLLYRRDFASVCCDLTPNRCGNVAIVAIATIVAIDVRQPPWFCLGLPLAPLGRGFARALAEPWLF